MFFIVFAWKDLYWLFGVRTLATFNLNRVLCSAYHTDVSASVSVPYLQWHSELSKIKWVEIKYRGIILCSMYMYLTGYWIIKINWLFLKRHVVKYSCYYDTGWNLFESIDCLNRKAVILSGVIKTCTTTVHSLCFSCLIQKAFVHMLTACH